MTMSVFDIFKIGIGPSSSHTVGPMKAALLFTQYLRHEGIAPDVRKVRVELFGSLGATGHGHGTVKAVVLGLQGQVPDTVDPALADPSVQEVHDTNRLRLAWGTTIPFSIENDIILHRRKRLEFHSNGMQLAAFDAEGSEVGHRTYFSIGGGFVITGEEARVGQNAVVLNPTPVPYPFTTGAQLLAHAHQTGGSFSWIMLQNELVRHEEGVVRAGLLHIWSVMKDCIDRGCRTPGTLPGGLGVRRRAAIDCEKLRSRTGEANPFDAMEWVTVFALAVNEENAAGGRVVTAPTNGAAGIIPAVLSYYERYVPGADEDGIVRFLLTAGAIAILFKEGASISGAEVGCQGEVGSACSMAAAGLAEVLGGTPDQVENAAEIGIEHNLGLTCDPIAGLVQIPCIERNAVGSVKAITAAHMSVRGDGEQFVPLDKAIKTMRDTGADMSVKYKETARGGLALNMTEC
jgi:L-serine dehydratase